MYSTSVMGGGWDEWSGWEEVFGTCHFAQKGGVVIGLLVTKTKKVLPLHQIQSLQPNHPFTRQSSPTHYFLKTFSILSSRISAFPSCQHHDPRRGGEEGRGKPTMAFLENQHGPEPDGCLARAADVDALRLYLPQEVVAVWGVPRNESALALSAEVEDLVGVLSRQLLEARVEVGADFRLGGVYFYQRSHSCCAYTLQGEKQKRLTVCSTKFNLRISAMIPLKSSALEGYPIHVLNWRYGLFGRRRLSW